MRRLLLTALVSMLVVSAGCVGLITGETVEFSSNEATVSDDTLQSTGYEIQNVSEQTTTRDVEVAGQERTIRLTNHIAQYSRSADILGLEVSEVSRFIVISTPGAQVAGQTLNPAASWSNQRLVEQIADRTGRIDDVQPDGNRTAQSLGESRDVGEFTGTTQVGGQELDVRIHVASFEHDGDVLIVAAIHPQAIDEEGAVDDLLGGIEHSGN